MYNLLKNKADGMHDEVVSFAQELIQTPSPSLEESAAATRIAKKMRELGYDRVIEDESGNVVGVLAGREAEPTVLLNCHMDTVAASSQANWKTPAFSGHIENGMLHGLGAADCKGGLAAQVYAAALLKRCLLPLKGNLVVAATVAEENGCSVGVRALMEHTLPDLGLHPDYAILGEPTGLGLYYGHDGWVELDIQIEGANPFHVDDAAEAVFNEYSGRFAGEPQAGIVHNPRFENEAGVRRATIQMERRLSPSDNVGVLLSQTKHEATMAAHASGAVAVGVMVRQERQRLYTGRKTVVRRVVHAWSTDPFHPLMERARQALSAADCMVRPGRWNLGRMGMGTAGSVLTRDFQIPTIGYGPGAEDKAHSVNECVDVKHLAEAVYGTAAIVHCLIGIPVFGWTSDEI